MKQLLASLLLLPALLWADPPPDLHAGYDQLLKHHVVDGLVSYDKLRANPAELNAYLDQLGSVSRKDYDSWNEQDQLAFLLNLYNAATLKLIVEENPRKSIKDIGNFIRGPWHQRFVELWGETRTLNELEHQIIRVDFLKVPETHFALVCAAIGCPPLRSEAYLGETLDDQLQDQKDIFLKDREKNRFDAKKKTLYLSPIFKWYKEDFEKDSGSLQKYLAKAWPEVGSDWKIRYTHYDWGLNDAE